MYKLMLADDEGIVRESLKFIVDKEFPGSFETFEAKTGRHVIELADEVRPDIAFMDIRMPGINGIDAMKEIRRTNPNIVFVIISAYDKFDYAKQALNLGVIDYINKPFDKAQIVAVLKKAMAEVDRVREQRTRELEIKEKLDSIVPIIENGLIQDLLSHEHFKENIYSERVSQVFTVKTDIDQGTRRIHARRGPREHQDTEELRDGPSRYLRQFQVHHWLRNG